MLRHGIVVPGTAPPQQCGGPAFCAVCNEEMLELEALALGIAQRYEEKMGRGDDAFEMLNKRWMSQLYSEQYRKSARKLICLRIKAEERGITLRAARAEYDRERKKRLDVQERKRAKDREYRKRPEVRAYKLNWMKQYRARLKGQQEAQL